MTQDFSSISSGLGSISSDISQVSNAVGQYVIMPASLFGLMGFPFDVEGVTTATLQSDITDNYAENNSTLQDNIAIRPKRFVLKNYVGELVYYGPGGSGSPSIVQTVLQKLTTINSYLPTLASATQQAQGLFNSVSSAATLNPFNSQFSLSNIFGDVSINGAASLFAGIKNLLTPQTKQASAYSFFKAMWQQRILCGVQTPFEFITNMAIESVVAIQDEDTKYMTTFTVTLKEMRFAKTTTTPYNQSQYKSPNQTSGANSDAGIGGSPATDAAINAGNTVPPPVGTPLDNGQTLSNSNTSMNSLVQQAGQLSQVPLPDTSASAILNKATQLFGKAVGP